jgi:hypothetical protein
MAATELRTGTPPGKLPRTWSGGLAFGETERQQYLVSWERAPALLSKSALAYPFQFLIRGGVDSQSPLKSGRVGIETEARSGEKLPNFRDCILRNKYDVPGA